jgi:hypothetical protein
MWEALWPALAALLGTAGPAPAVDLNRLDAPLVKEPVYRSGAPHYCLLVFGQEAKLRVWAVIDGDTLYVDRNGNGDLTEEGEKFTLPRFRPSSDPQFSEEREGPGVTIHDGKLRHTELRVTQRRIRPDFVPRDEYDKQLKALAARDPKGLVYAVRVSVEVSELPRGKLAFTGRLDQSAGADERGALQFTRKAKDAPVIHFGGPLHLALLCRQTLPLGESPGDLNAMLGTPGRGPGTFASIAYAGVIGTDTHPVAVVAFPHREAGKGPVTVRAVLRHRC